MAQAADLLREAQETAFAGWDFSWLDDRLAVTPVPWDFTAEVGDALRGARRALDMETGGGEWLSSMPQLPSVVIATEAWPPNVRVAAERLRPHRGLVVHDEGALDNVLQDDVPRGRLPFRTASFDLVTNCHGAYAPAEVARVLEPNGVFLTQQADSASRQFHELLGLRPPMECRFDVEFAAWQAEQAGLCVDETEAGEEELLFRDIGALAWYLKAIPWCIPDFSIERCDRSLMRLHGSEIVVRQARFRLRCHK
jgi:SAM-dependent methyltransferase